FDRLRLRETLGHAFAALGFEGDEAWRGAARIKVVLLASAGVGKAKGEPEKATAAAEKKTAESKTAATPGKVKDGETAGKSMAAKPAQANVPGEGSEIGLAPDLWLDPDVRWLTG